MYCYTISQCVYQDFASTFAVLILLIPFLVSLVWAKK